MELDLFLGRFHPLMVHLPIGFLLLTVLFELLSLRNENFRKAVVVGYWATSATGVVALLTGFLLSKENNYFIDALDTHKWVAVVFVILVTGLAYAKHKNISWSSKVNLLILAGAVGLVSLTGHLGGNLTHGPGFLTEYGPVVFQSSKSFSNSFSNQPADSIQVYKQLVQPIFTQKCAGCHNATSPLGGLNIMSYDSLFVTASQKVPIVPGKAWNSELFQRLILPETDPDFMPKGHAPLSYSELMLIRYWIDNGADKDKKLDYREVSNELGEILLNHYEIDVTPQPYYTRVSVDSLSVRLLDSARRNHFHVDYLGEGTNFLEVKYQKDTLIADDVKYLVPLSSHLFRLNLSNTYISDSMISHLPQGPHLQQLNLANAKVSDSIFHYINQLPQLTLLNLHSTSITSKGLESLVRDPSKDSRLVLYLWNTSVTEEEIQAFKSQYPEVEVVGQFKFIPPDTVNVSKFVPEN